MSAKKILNFSSLFLVIISLSFRITETEPPSPFSILNRMADSIDKVKTLKLKLISLERVQNKYVQSTAYIKVSYEPIKKLYFKNPAKHLEILYVQNKNENKSLVKHPSLPVSLWLDPNGSLMKKNQHYTIHELGFQYISNTIEYALSKEKDNLLKSLSYIGVREKNGKECYVLVYESSSFEYIPHTIKEKETVVSIARHNNLNEYIIRDKNNLYYDYGFLKKNTAILIPKMFCKKAFLYIDEKTFLPVSVNLYDDKGLLESYDYMEVQHNIPIKDEEFTKHYKEYNF